jgi:hypothetical protein
MLLYIAAGKSASRTFRLVLSSFGRAKASAGSSLKDCAAINSFPSTRAKTTNPMWNQDWWKEPDYDADEFDRFPKGAGYPGGKADWGWMQIILASLKPQGRAGIVKSAIGMSDGWQSRSRSLRQQVKQASDSKIAPPAR